jgi:hypothetical protein
LFFFGAAGVSVSDLKKDLVLEMPLTSTWLASSTVASDFADGDADGTASGTPAPTFGATGVPLDGVDQLVTIPNHTRYTPGDGAGTDGPFSMCITVTRTAAGATDPVLCKRSASTAATSEWAFYFLSSDAIDCAFYQDATTTYIHARSALGSEASYAGTATRYCCTYDGSESETGISVYRDGVDITDAQIEVGTYTGLTARSVDVTVGFFASTFYFDGTLSDAAIWRADLSPALVAQDTRVTK